MKKKNFELITIKEICEEAGVNRSTFYLHYDNVNDLLTETVEAVYRDFFDHFGTLAEKDVDIEEKNPEELFLITPRYLMPYLEFVEENRRLFGLMYEKCDVMGVEKMYAKWFGEIFGPILTKFGVPQREQSYIMIYYLKGLIGLITEWIREDCAISKEELAGIIQKCIIKP